MVTFESVESEVKDVEGVRVRVATPLALYHLKKDTVRPIDWQDATALPNQFQLKDGNWMAVQRIRSMRFPRAPAMTSVSETVRV